MGRSGKKAHAPVQSELFGLIPESEQSDPQGITNGPVGEKVPAGSQAGGPATDLGLRVARPDHLVSDSLEDVRKLERDLGPRLTWARMEVARVRGPKLGDGAAPLSDRAEAFVERCRVFREQMEPGR